MKQEYKNGDRLCIICEKVIDKDSTNNLCEECMKKIDYDTDAILDFNMLPNIYYTNAEKHQVKKEAN